MNACMRMQINFALNPTEFYMTNISNVVVLVLWFEQSGEIPEDLAELLKQIIYFLRFTII